MSAIAKLFRVACALVSMAALGCVGQKDHDHDEGSSGRDGETAIAPSQELAGTRGARRPDQGQGDLQAPDEATRAQLRDDRMRGAAGVAGEGRPLGPGGPVPVGVRSDAVDPFGLERGGSASTWLEPLGVDSRSAFGGAIGGGTDGPEEPLMAFAQLPANLTVQFRRFYIGTPASSGTYRVNVRILNTPTNGDFWSCPLVTTPNYGTFIPPPEGLGSDSNCDIPASGKQDIGNLTLFEGRTIYEAPILAGTTTMPVEIEFQHAQTSSGRDFTWVFDVNVQTGAVTFDDPQFYPPGGDLTAEQVVHTDPDGVTTHVLDCARSPDQWMLCWQVCLGQEFAANGRDDDCNGIVDTDCVVEQEVYDGVDNDCDGEVDNLPDQDGDGLFDVWETEGIDGDGDGLPDFFLTDADPLRKDIYVEVDAMSCTVAGGDCAAGDTHSHLPELSGDFQPVIDAFDVAPVPNPGGSDDGIVLHIDVDPTDPLDPSTGYDLLPHLNVCGGFGSGTCFGDLGEVYFGTAAERSSPNSAAILAAKRLAYHYNIWLHTQPGIGAGSADEPGDDLLIGLFTDSTLPNGAQAVRQSLFMHELGHNLDLHHGGHDIINYKPNYLSVMSYFFTGKGGIQTLENVNVLDYSRAALPTLVEVDSMGAGQLDETLGVQGMPTPGGLTPLAGHICPEPIDVFDPATAAIDWNCDGDVTDTGVRVDVNSDQYCVEPGDDGVLDSTPPMGSDDQTLGQILAGADGCLQSAVANTGLDVNDMFNDNANPALQNISAGADGVLGSTPACDDEIVNAIVPGAGASSVVSVADPMLDVPVLDGAGAVVMILPGPDLELQATRIDPDMEVPYLIRSGADGQLQSLSPSTGLVGNDRVCFFFGGAPVVCPGPDLVLETSVATGDQPFERITDGLDRICQSEPASGDVATMRVVGSVQPPELEGSNDWEVEGPHPLVFDFKGTSAFGRGGVSPVYSAERTAQELFDSLGQGLPVDLELEVLVAESASAGSELLYQLAVTNHGPATASVLLVRGTLPEKTTTVACSADAGGTCMGQGTTPMVQFQGLGAGATAMAELVVQVGCDFPTAEPLTALLTTITGASDLVPSNNQVSTETLIAPPAPEFVRLPRDLEISQCDSPDLGTVIAQDACTGLASLSNDAPEHFELGLTEVTWVAVNSLGVASTVTQGVTAVLGDDPSCCPEEAEIIYGSSENDVLVGGPGPDCILGFGGQDQLIGGGGNDALSGGDGDDTLYGGTGDDFLYGGSGQDQLSGDSGQDLVSGGDGDDLCWGGSGDDELLGGQGQDQLYGEGDDDRLRGEDGDDTLDGGPGNDYLEGGGLHDACFGGSGVDTFARCESPGVPDSCQDGMLSGAETDIDCGGTGCAPCSSELMCSVGGDCLSGGCSDGLCLEPLSAIVAEVTVTGDWGTGYCASLEVSNVSEDPTSTWSVALELGDSEIYTSWNAVFNGSAGTVGTAPVEWNVDLEPGETIDDIGFCANRTTPGVLPEVIGAGGA